MQTLSNELKGVISRRLELAGSREILAIASALCADDVSTHAAAIEVPAPRRFEVIGDEVEVRDNKTGLIWTRDNVGDKSLTWTQAKEACAKLTLGGHSWRLPTVQELLTLVDYERAEPAIDVNAFPSCESACYWTSTPYASSPSDDAWCVYFGDGFSSWGNRSDEFFVRAVRASQ